ncbi:hypothetical protein [Nocardioides alcanivorans]|uniref:hypothetical protein n=1 Tax=Nocardioides alcanivorans TaxID=2897352 RepID=UPI001F1F82B6|nr:hypothetical protein [Nocardioides alcanivorans]
MRSQHHHEVEAAGPPGQAGAGPGNEWHRAPRFEHGAEQPRVGTGRDHRTGTVALAASERLTHGLRGLPRRTPNPGAGLGQLPQLGVDPSPDGLVV